MIFFVRENRSIASCQRPATLMSDEWHKARKGITDLHRLIKGEEAGTLRIRTRNELETCGTLRIIYNQVFITHFVHIAKANKESNIAASDTGHNT